MAAETRVRAFVSAEQHGKARLGVLPLCSCSSCSERGRAALSVGGSPLDAAPHCIVGFFFITAPAMSCSNYGALSASTGSCECPSGLG